MGYIAAAIGGGALLSAGSGALGAGASRTAGHEARDQGAYLGMSQQRQVGNMLYGPGFNSTWQGGGVYTPTYPTDAQGNITYSPGSILGQQSRLTDLYSQRGKGIQSNFNQGMAGVRNIYGQSEGKAAQFGAGGEALIDQETARSLKSANQMSGARLAASGFGNSTAGANQTSQNAINAGRMAGEQKLGLRQATLDRVLGVRGQMASTQNQNIGRRTDLQNSLLNNEMLYRQQPIQTQLNSIGAMNPQSGQNFAGLYPGVSPAGTALGAAGNTLGMLGGYGLTRGGGGSAGLYPGEGGATSNPYGYLG